MLLEFLKKHMRQPKFQLGTLLSLIFLSAIIYTQSFTPIATLFIAVIATVAADLIFIKARKQNLFFPSAALVTAFIIALLTDPKLPWYDIALSGMAAMASKHFLRFSGRHVFNPAAFGLFTSSLLFNHNVSWWAVSFQQFFIFHLSSFIYFLILISPILISAVRMRRFRIILAFLFIYTILTTLILSANQLVTTNYSLLTTILDPTILFFALVMRPEPMTSPNNHNRQFLFGISVALLTIVLSLPIVNSQFLIFNFPSDPLTFSLLIGNLLFFRFR